MGILLMARIISKSLDDWPIWFEGKFWVSERHNIMTSKSKDTGINQLRVDKKEVCFFEVEFEEMDFEDVVYSKVGFWELEFLEVAI